MWKVDSWVSDTKWDSCRAWLGFKRSGGYREQGPTVLLDSPEHLDSQDWAVLYPLLPLSLAAPSCPRVQTITIFSWPWPPHRKASWATAEGIVHNSCDIRVSIENVWWRVSPPFLLNSSKGKEDRMCFTCSSVWTPKLRPRTVLPSTRVLQRSVGPTCAEQVNLLLVELVRIDLGFSVGGGIVLQEHSQFASLMSSSKETAVWNYWVIFWDFSLSEIFIMGRTL